MGYGHCVSIPKSPPLSLPQRMLHLNFGTCRKLSQPKSKAHVSYSLYKDSKVNERDLEFDVKEIGRGYIFLSS